MRFIILANGREYHVEPISPGTMPDVIIAEKFPGWIFVDDASTKAEADSKIEEDRDRRRAYSW